MTQKVTWGWCLLVALTLAITLAFLRGAFANEPEPFRGIWCDTKDQIERVVTLGTELGGAAQGIEAVNKEVGGESPACVYTTILGVRLNRLSTVQSPDGLLDVTEWKVAAVIHPMFGIVPVEKDLHWFTLEGSKSQGV